MKLLPLLLFPLFLQAQVKLKPLPLATYFVAGVADGLRDAALYHYDRLDNRLHLNDKWADPAISWRNKYKNGDPSQGARFPGSTGVFVFTTDLVHFSKFVQNTFTVATVVFSFGQKKKWYYYIADALIYQTVNRAGFYLMYNVIAK